MAGARHFMACVLLHTQLNLLHSNCNRSLHPQCAVQRVSSNAVHVVLWSAATHHEHCHSNLWEWIHSTCCSVSPGQGLHSRPQQGQDMSSAVPVVQHSTRLQGQVELTHHKAPRPGLVAQQNPTETPGSITSPDCIVDAGLCHGCCLCGSPQSQLQLLRAPALHQLHIKGAASSACCRRDAQA
jgi:hypothetical protein